MATPNNKALLTALVNKKRAGMPATPPKATPSTGGSTPSTPSTGGNAGGVLRKPSEEDRAATIARYKARKDASRARWEAFFRKLLGESGLLKRKAIPGRDSAGKPV